MIRIIISFFIVFYFAQTLSAQEDLRLDSAFFQRQQDEYQRWLDNTGLGKTLHVHSLWIYERQVYLNLAFPSENIDTVLQAWKDLQTAWARENSILLEDQLFFRMITLMGLPQETARIQIYDTYNSDSISLFFRGIYFDADTGRVLVAKNDPRDKMRDIKLSYADISGAKKLSRTEIAQAYSRERVFDLILEFAQERYGAPTCRGRWPQVKRLLHEDYLRFEVVNLCKEVLKDESNPLICSWLNYLGYECDWTKRELLTFTIVYIPHDSGFGLNITIEGKVGSGYYEEVRRDGYWDMENDFKSDLEDYADQIALEIKNYLSEK